MQLIRNAIVCLALTGCSISIQHGAARQSSDQTAIREARTAQNRAIVAGDGDLVATFWTDDITVRRALGQPLAGKAAARALFEGAARTDSTLVYQRITTSVDVSAQWPVAFESGDWTGYRGSASGPAMIGGRYSAQWVKRDGRWLIRSEVFVPLTCAGSGCAAKAVP